MRCARLWAVTSPEDALTRSRWFAVGVGLLVGVPLLLLVAVKLTWGGGSAFPDVSTPPAVPPSQVEAVVDLEMPPGCVAVSREGRVFFDTHPFAAPGRFGLPHVFELVDGQARPWPSAEDQDLFVAPFGLTADAQGRLWFVEPATLDRSATRLLAFDIDSGELLLDHTLPDGVGRFAQDLRVSPDGRHVVLADTGAFAFTPGQLLVFDVDAREIVRTVQHPSFQPQDWFIRRYDGRPHRVAWGLLTFQVGVDGIAFGPDGDWLYYATMSHDTLYRVPADRLLDPAVSDDDLADAIEVVGPKPQSDGITVTDDGHVLLADVENGGIAEVAPDGTLRTLTASDDVIWADGVAARDGVVWFTDSAIPAYLQQSLAPPPRDVLASAAPYHLYRFER